MEPVEVLARRTAKRGEETRKVETGDLVTNDPEVGSP